MLSTKKGRIEKKHANKTYELLKLLKSVSLSDVKYKWFPWEKVLSLNCECFPKRAHEYVKTKIGGIFCHFYTTMMSIKCKQCTRIEQ